MRKKKIITPVMDWQIDKDVMVDPESEIYHENAVKMFHALTQVAKEAGLYHVDGDEGENEALHFQFVMVDPEVFYKLAIQVGMKEIKGAGFDNISDILDAIKHEQEDDDA